MGIPEDDLEAAVRCLKEGQTKSFDVGYCERADRYFSGCASMGWDAQVTQTTNSRSKRLGGTTNYILGLLQELARYRHYNLTVTLEENEDPDFSGEAMLTAIGNGPRYGAGMHVAPDAIPTDGKFHITIVRRLRRLSLLKVFPKVYKGDHMTHPSVVALVGKKLRVEAKEQNCLYQVDGEVLGTLPDTFVTIPNGLQARVPVEYIPYHELWQKKKEGSK